jgi:hypothetical protein
VLIGGESFGSGSGELEKIPRPIPRLGVLPRMRAEIEQNSELRLV